jgi:hypothetical protein
MGAGGGARLLGALAAADKKERPAMETLLHGEMTREPSAAALYSEIRLRGDKSFSENRA